MVGTTGQALTSALSPDEMGDMLPVVDVTDAPTDAFRPDSRIVTFSQYGKAFPLPDDRVMLTTAAWRRPGRVYAADYGKKLVFVEFEPS